MLVNAVCEEFESSVGDEGVDEAGDEGEVCFEWFADPGQAGEVGGGGLLAG